MSGWLVRRRARRPLSPGAGLWKPFPIVSSAAAPPDADVTPRGDEAPPAQPRPFDFVPRKRRRATAPPGTPGRAPEGAALKYDTSGGKRIGADDESATRWRAQSGTAILCLPPNDDGDDQWFCGHFVFSRAGTRAQGQILATELPCDGCEGCGRGDARRFALELKLALASGGDAAAAAEVMRTGGDMAKLRWIARADDRGDRARVEFDPEAMHTEARAARLIHEYFPNVVRDATEAELRACVVCVGQMRLENIEFGHGEASSGI